MENQVRLAHAQGLLTRPSLNFAQTWALQYWFYLQRREQLDDKQAELELQVYNLFPERWEQLYKNGGAAAGDLGEAFPGEVEIPVTDAGDLDSFYANLDAPRSMSGSEVNGSSVLGFATGQGRRV